MVTALRTLSAARHVGKVVVRRPPPLPTNGNWVLTGAAGGLCQLAASHLAAQGAAHLTLTCRTGRTSTALPGALLAQRASVCIVAQDSAVQADAQVAMRGEVMEGGAKGIQHPTPLTPPTLGVLCTAGTLRDALLARQSKASLHQVWAPKAAGVTLATEALAACQPLHAIQLFSSVAGSLGGAGQANYAMANAFVDALGRRHAGRGRPARSIGWGPWADAGMASQQAGLEQRLRTQGYGSLRAAQGLELLSALLRSSAAVASGASLAADMEWARRDRWPMRLGFVVEKDVAVTTDLGVVKTAITASISLPPPERRRRLSKDSLLRTIGETAASVLGSTPASDAPLVASGLDSLGAVEFRNSLATRIGLQLPGTLVFDYPTVAAIADFVGAALVQSAEETLDGSGDDDGFGQVNKWSPAPSVVPIHVSAGITDDRRQPTAPAPIAIRSVAQTLPGSTASSLPSPRIALPSSDAIRRVPLDRWRLDDPPVKTSTLLPPFGGFVPCWSMLDAEAFGLSPAESGAMDPQQWALLAHTAGMVVPDGPRAQTSVFVGIARLVDSPATALRARESIERGGGHVGTGRALSAAAGRLSYVYALRGTCVSLDTACSSSLLAVHLARREIAHQGGVDGARGERHAHAPSGGPAALAAGVSLPLSCEVSAAFAMAGMMSPSGRCQTLDAAADGYVRAEGCVVLCLAAGLRDEAESATLYQTQASHNPIPNSHTPIQALIVASASNQDGRSSSLTAPHGPSQTEVVLAAVRDAGPHANFLLQKLIAVELHGTGTPLGDPIEVSALREAVGASRRPPELSPVSLQAIKASAGHSETVAGAAGILHAARTLRELERPQLMHLRALNPYVRDAFEGARAKAARSVFAAARQQGPAQRAPLGAAIGVSAFAFQGTNAHAIVQAEDEEGGYATLPAPPRPWRFAQPADAASCLPLLKKVLGRAKPLVVTIQADLDAPSAAYLRDHVVSESGLGRSL